MNVFLLAGAGIMLVACGRPTARSVQTSFRKDNPTYSVVSVYPGEGGGGAAYFHINYKKSKDGEIHEDVWQYLKESNGSWQIEHKETLR
jgi:hypothetical protein